MKATTKTQIATPYAQALLEIGLAEKKLEIFTKNVFYFNFFFKKYPWFTDYLVNPVIPNSRKKALIVKACGKYCKVNSKLVSFLFLLIEKNRIDCYPEIARQFLQLISKKINIPIAVLTYFEPFQRFQKQRLREILKNYHGEVGLAYFKDPKLLGGFKLNLASEIIDFSINNEIQEFYNFLIKET